MPSSDSDRIAVLIDADNTSPKHASPLMEEVAKYGTPTVKRAYGDWTTQQLAGWKSKLNQHAIQPMQQFAYTTGKNSTDSALIIDAMDLLYSANVDAFAIVSSDSDFTRLATRLRESGRTVIGLGLRKTPQSLVSACDRFVYLELLNADDATAESDAEASSDSSEDAPARLPDLRRLLTSAVDAASHEDGWASLSAIGSQISRSNPSFDVRAYGEPKLLDLVRSQAYLEVVQPETGGVRVRLAPHRSSRGSGKKAAEKAVPVEEPVTEITGVTEVTEPVAEVAAPAEAAPPAKRTRTRKATTRKTTAEKAASAEPVAEPAAAEPVAPEPAPEPVVEPVVETPSAPEPPKVTTRRRVRKTVEPKPTS